MLAGRLYHKVFDRNRYNALCAPVTDNGSYHALDWLETRRAVTEEPGFTVSVAEFFAFRDLLFVSCTCKHEQKPLRSIFIAFSNAVFVDNINGEAGQKLKFDRRIKIPENASVEIKLGFEFYDGSRFLVENPSNPQRYNEKGDKVYAKFAEIFKAISRPNVLEIGSRIRPGAVSYRSLLPDDAQYTGFDIKPGENVHVVGDAHNLSRYFPAESFDVVYSMAVFEHLMVPWKVAIEMNGLMKAGAIGFVFSHQTWPLHEEPWDFWRFSDKSWHAIFNKFTGFEVIETGLSDRAYVVPAHLNAITYRMDEGPAFLGSMVLFRKIGASTVDWPVGVFDLMNESYPS
jgi:hypothetical protein